MKKTDNNAISLIGTVVKSLSGFYYLDYGGAVYETKPRGSFRFAEISPIVGDKVRFSPIDGTKGVIDEILPRSNCLKRPAVSNVDKIIIVSSFKNPAPDTYLIDRLTAIAEFNGIKPVIVFNKSDTGDFADFERIYINAGFNTYVVSALDKASLTGLKKEFENCISVMAGNTGVGKSSLLNALFGTLNLKTGEVSNALGRGRHTTRHTELLKNDVGGYVIDTPGFSSIDQLENRFEFKNSLPDCFKDFSPYTDLCRFSDCSHISEKGCAVLEAVSLGKIEKTRHRSYTMLYNELKGANNWEK
ncbi:MAG: ribosome small subunit-dependent GTPase A [Clostridia bacterium]|nr:ribosome small subunit-dependent GTPase A [Clostridia bacterium]